MTLGVDALVARLLIIVVNLRLIEEVCAHISHSFLLLSFFNCILHLSLHIMELIFSIIKLLFHFSEESLCVIASLLPLVALSPLLAHLNNQVLVVHVGIFDFLLLSVKIEL